MEKYINLCVLFLLVLMSEGSFAAARAAGDDTPYKDFLMVLKEKVASSEGTEKETYERGVNRLVAIYNTGRAHKLHDPVLMEDAPVVLKKVMAVYGEIPPEIKEMHVRSVMMPIINLLLENSQNRAKSGEGDKWFKNYAEGQLALNKIANSPLRDNLLYLPQTASYETVAIFLKKLVAKLPKEEDAARDAKEEEEVVSLRKTKGPQSSEYKPKIKRDWGKHLKHVETAPTSRAGSSDGESSKPAWARKGFLKKTGRDLTS